LNFAGCWDPSLAFVMGGGLCVTFPAFAWARSRAEAGPLHEGMDFEQPKKSSGPDAQLVIGSAVFGLGWGMTGLCPGPDIAGILPNSVLGWERGALYLLFMASLCAAWMLTDRALAMLSQDFAVAPRADPDAKQAMLLATPKGA